MARTTFKRYRDKDTGRFVSSATWNRSKAHGGVRYKQELVPLHKPPEAPERPRLPRPATMREEEELERLEEELEQIIEDENAEYGGAFDSPKKGRK